MALPPNDNIHRLRSRVKARVKGEELPAWGATHGRSLREVLDAGDPVEIRIACYRRDERKALAVQGDISREPAEPAVADDEFETMLAALALPADDLSEALAVAIELPDAYGQLALRLLVGLLQRGADGGRRHEAVVRAYVLLPTVFSPYGRWLLTRAVATAAHDAEELARAGDVYRQAAKLTLQPSGSGAIAVDGYPWHGDPTQPMRVPPGRRTAALMLDEVTRIQRLELQPGEQRAVMLQANLLTMGFEGRSVEHDPQTGLPQRIFSEVDGVEMVYVPPGEFTLGLDPDLESVAQAAVPQHKLQDAGPARRVAMHGFYIDLRPCPIHAFRRFLQRGGYSNPAYWSEGGWDAHHGPQRPDRQAWEQWVLQESRRLPAEGALGHVSWHEASAAARWSGKRLPTEAEWERAMLHWGSARLGLTHAEWCADTWQPHGDPEAASAPFVDGEDRAAKVLRGTIISFHGDLITAKIRSDADPDERFWTVGFRTVWVP